MGACPSSPGGLNLGCGSIGEFRLPQRDGCHDCFAGEIMEGCEDGANPVEKSLSNKEADPTKAAGAQNEFWDFEKELSDLPPEAARDRVERIVRDWREKLKVGMLVSLNGEMVNLSYDPALQCLDARELGMLYPLAALHECTHLPRSTEGASYELRAEFNSEAVVFKFDRTYDRAAFALCVHALAVEARQDKWHEDWDAEGFDEEDSDISGREDGTNSTADPEDHAAVDSQEKASKAREASLAKQVGKKS